MFDNALQTFGDTLQTFGQTCQTFGLQNKRLQTNCFANVLQNLLKSVYWLSKCSLLFPFLNLWAKIKRFRQPQNQRIAFAGDLFTDYADVADLKLFV